MGKVLVVDDCADIRLLLERALKNKGYEVISAANGAEAQAIVEGPGEKCIVILDLMMPVMSGQEFLQWKNNQPQLQDLPILVVSAQPDYKLNGILGCMKKPVDLKELFAIVQSHCKAG